MIQSIGEIMTKDVETVSLIDTIQEVATKMRDLNVGSMPVVDNQKLVGIVTDRDIVIRGLAEGMPNTTEVQRVMTTDLITVKEEQSVRHAAHLMSQYKIRRLPVIKGDNQLVGIVALGDLAVEDLTDSAAKTALSEISEPTRGQDFM